MQSLSDLWIFQHFLPVLLWHFYLQFVEQYIVMIILLLVKVKMLGMYLVSDLLDHYFPYLCCSGTLLIVQWKWILDLKQANSWETYYCQRVVCNIHSKFYTHTPSKVEIISNTYSNNIFTIIIHVQHMFKELSFIEVMQRIRKKVMLWIMEFAYTYHCKNRATL